ncbi:MAG: hypothetical protein JWP26_1178 [Devosia sp.]|uniref:hypothetical protein n=1 Tax=Devosia sp. TaxID=1871048 RepID=UPI00262156A0|nr:hypothetical protein [Devosia sp.]MDB5586208.1 hypothetical protein [Devosia sp.]
MSLKEIHEAVAAEFGDRITLSFDKQEWFRLAKDAAEQSLQSVTLTDLFTPLAELMADVEFDASTSRFEFFPPNQLTKMRARNITVTVSLKTAAGLGKISSYLIEYAEINFEINVVDGKILLTPTQDQTYRANPPDRTDPYRQSHLDYLLQHGWTQANLDDFTNVTEMFLGHTLGGMYVSDAFGGISIFDLSALFPGLKMSGSFNVKGLTVSATEEIVCFAPDFFEKLEPTPCSLEMVKDSIYSVASPNAPGSNSGKVRLNNLGPKIFRAYEDNPVLPNAGTIYAYVPKGATQVLFDPIETLKKGRDGLFSTGDSYRIGPFVVRHLLRLEVDPYVDMAWGEHGPSVKVGTSFRSHAELDVDLKIGKLRTDVASGSADSSFNPEYYGSLAADVSSGNLSFVGEFGSTAAVDFAFTIKTPLGFADNIINWFLNSVCKPVLRGMFSLLLSSANWSFVSRAAIPFPSIDNGLDIGGYFRDSVDQMSMSVAINYISYDL